MLGRGISEIVLQLKIDKYSLFWSLIFAMMLGYLKVVTAWRLVQLNSYLAEANKTLKLI